MDMFVILAALAAQAAGSVAQPVVAAPLPRMTIYGAGGGSGGTVYLQVHAGDLDGDGLPDDAVVKLACAGGAVQAAHYTIVSPRDQASGQASGKRTHHPVTFVKEWGPATPLLAQMRPGYDLKANKGARTAGYNLKENKSARMAADGGGWTAIELTDTGGMCAAAEAAAKATKTRSNIQNN